MDNIPFSPSRLDFTNFFKQKLARYFRGKKDIVDIGSGKLYFYDLLTNISASGTYLGIDLDPGKIQKPKNNLKADILKQDFLEFSSKNKFDIAVCLWVLEHIKDDRLALKIASDALKPNGYFILAVPSVWSWSFEFGRHGYHYYNLKDLMVQLAGAGFEVIETYSSGGFFGFIFMILYNWPRFLILIPTFFVYKLADLARITKDSWPVFSKKVIDNTVYSYHRTKSGLAIHNSIVEKVVKLDNEFKILPASYILISKKA